MAQPPSYLTKRGDIYYFQTRIPAEYMHDKANKNRLIRRSTGTGNHREALKIARTWWVELMDKTTDEEIAEISDRENALYLRGVVLHEEYNQIHPRDDEGKNEFFGNLRLSSFDKEAFENFVPEEVMWEKPTDMLPDPAGEANDNVIAAVPPCPFRLSALQSKYIEGRMNGVKPWALSSKRKFDDAILLLKLAVGDIYGHELTLDELQYSYVNNLFKVPLFFKKKRIFKNADGSLKSLDEIIAIADEFDLERLASKTIFDYASNLKTFLKWASRGSRRYIFGDWMDAFEDFDKLPVTYKYTRPPFTLDDLSRIFRSVFYRDGLLMERPERHWAPLIALFTGARRSEICKLYVEDIIRDQETGIWCFDIVHENVKRRTKTPFFPFHQLPHRTVQETRYRRTSL